ncbi:MAG: SDR family NAD(P)-dependent oxidoreductase [Rikenellaceae bacterium]|nr:SDR family NAD(P)-dependent oxidoreductase [Rikenellaceae bacterium]
MTPIEQLVEISRHYGADSCYVIAGGGNTSYKDSEKLWVKASGSSLATITEEGFAVLDRAKLADMATKQYSADTAEREEQVKCDLAAACLSSGRRPSVETSLHDIMPQAFIVHLHPTLVNALMCAQDAEKATGEIFGDSVLYIPYTDPGYVLFRKVADGLTQYRSAHGREPRAILLQNHGIFVGGETPDEIKETYEWIMSSIGGRIKEQLPAGEPVCCPQAKEVIPALRAILSGEGTLKTLRVHSDGLTAEFSKSPEHFGLVSQPFSPDIIVYCKSQYIYSETADIDSIAAQIRAYTDRNGYTPKVLLIKGIGLVAVGDDARGAQVILDVFLDMMKIAWLAQSFGGEHPMTREQIEFIDNWEVENYRRKVAAASSAGRMEGRTAIVTGAGQGFGEGIAAELFAEGANIVIADINEQAGEAVAARFNAEGRRNGALFVKTDVSNMESLSGLMDCTVCAFGGVDLFVSNAGVLRAGSLEDMTPEVFEFVTRINYNAYFYCCKAVSPVMKLQNRYNATKFCDIVQINSKSGLRGSKANFAYAGGKFGGVGLTQSFALELAPYRIKVNSVCPGNFYEGPLWSDPENGLFVQYLKAGKVPGAKTIEDVREFYMAQVPMRKDTSPADVTRAIMYAVEQECETGQAIPVTGGQVMMS